MRPVLKPPPPPEIESYPVADLLLDALGTYCATCERRLIDSCRLWHAQRRAITSRPVPQDWPHLLTLCQNCADSAALAPANSTPLLLPDRDRTFVVDGQSPLVYVLRPVQRVLLDAAGEPDGPSEAIERVLVESRTPAAQATIDYFALNTRYYDRTSNTLRIPRYDFYAMLDRRVDVRTDAWAAAVDIAVKLKGSEDPRSRRSFLTMGLHMLAGLGYWSAWATVLWQTLQDRAVLTALLLPPAPAAPAAVGGALAGQAHVFPGTRTDWLA